MLANRTIFIILLFFQLTLSGQNTVKIGIIADVHDEKERLQAFIHKSVEEQPDFIIQLGDLSNGKDTICNEMAFIWNAYPGEKYHVLGNHDMDYASKEDILRILNMDGKYYSFDCQDYHFVVLDCNYILKDGKYVDYSHANYYIPYPNRDLINPEQIKWLEEDINSTDKQVIIFSHQSFDDLTIRGTNPVPNRLLVRDVINKLNNASPNGNKVIACFAGHDHIDFYNQIDDVHYFAINSAYGFKKSLELKEGIYGFITLNPEDKTITIQGTSTDFNKKPEKEDYEPYSLEYILPYIKDRKVMY